MKILTVDDSKIIRKVVAGTIEALGHQVLAAGNGREALEVLEKHADGASHYLTKPFSPEALATHILECLGQGGSPS